MRSRLERAMGTPESEGELRVAVLRRLNDLMEAPPAPPRKPKRASQVLKFLSTPLVVTLIGSGTLAWVTQRWQERSAKQDREISERKQELDNQQRVIVEFADKFPVALHHYKVYMDTLLWLTENGGSQEATYAYGMKYPEVRALSE